MGLPAGLCWQGASWLPAPNTPPDTPLVHCFAGWPRSHCGCWETWDTGCQHHGARVTGPAPRTCAALCRAPAACLGVPPPPGCFSLPPPPAAPGPRAAGDAFHPEASDSCPPRVSHTCSPPVPPTSTNTRRTREGTPPSCPHGCLPTAHLAPSPPAPWPGAPFTSRGPSSALSCPLRAAQEVTAQFSPVRP